MTHEDINEMSRTDLLELIEAHGTTIEGELTDDELRVALVRIVFVKL